MHAFIVEPGNPHDLTDEDVQELHDLITAADGEADVRIIRRGEEGYGVSLVEVLHVFVENPELVVSAGQSIKALVAWARARWGKDGRRRSVILYGPDGEPLKTIDIASPEGEPRERPGDSAQRRDPPRGA